MPTQTVAPTATGTENDWALGAGASVVAAVAANDGDTTFIYRAATSGVLRRQQFTFPALPSDFDSLVSANVTAVMRRFSGTVAAFVNWAGADASHGNIGTSYGAYAGTPVTSGSKATIEAYQGGPGALQGAGNEIYCTQVYRTVQYVAGGGWMFVDFLGCLVGAAATLGEIARAVAMYNAAQRAALQLRGQAITIGRDEVVMVARALAAWKRPAFSR